MSRVCQITGKKGSVGNHVSHSNKKSKRRFEVNLLSKNFYYAEQDCWIKLRVSAAGIRLIDKVGLHNALVTAVNKGYCDWKSIQVVG